jgi:hypothetical protein
MKKELQKTARLLSKAALVFATLSAAQLSMASEAQGLQVEVPVHGRATLTVEDLQTLLGIQTRDPSSQAQMQQQDAVASAPIFQVQLSDAERKGVARIIQKLKMERMELAQKLEKEKADQVEKLRTERRKIQISRTRSSEENSSLGQNLFVSLLAEANVEAGMDSALTDFDQKNGVEILFEVDTSGQRKVSAVKISGTTVWSDMSGLNKSYVARR